MSATPENRRDAWLKLVQHLERELLATREHGKTMTRARLAQVPAWGQDAQKDADDWEATAWAAQRLLDAISKLKAPEVPVDDTKGQEVIPFPTAEDVLVNLGLEGSISRHPASGPSTSGDNPGDEAERFICHADPAKPIPVGQDCGWKGCPLRGSDGLPGGPACFLRRPE